MHRVANNRKPRSTKDRRTGEVIQRRGRRIKGLMADAAALGVHRNHLYLVLSGQRKSGILQARYAALKAGQALGDAVNATAAARPRKNK